MANRKISLSKPWQKEHFPVLSLFFHLCLPKILQAHPHKNYIFKINKDRCITSQSLGFEVEICGLIKHLKLGGIFTTFYPKWLKFTWWLNGSHGYHANAISLIVPFQKSRKIDLTPYQVLSCYSKVFMS